MAVFLLISILFFFLFCGIYARLGRIVELLKRRQGGDK